MATRSSGTCGDRSASLIATLLATARELASTRPQIETPPIDHVVDAYLDDLRARSRPSYVRKDEARLRVIIVSCPTASPEEVAKFRARLVAHGTSKQTANYYVDALRRCLEWAVNVAGLLPRHDLDRLPKLDVRDSDRRKLRRALTEPEVQSLLEVSAQEDRDRLHAQTPLWRTLIETGLRWGEAIAAQPEHIVNDALVIPARNTKNGKARAFPLTHVPELLATLRRALPFRTPRGEPHTPDSHNALRSLYRMLEKAGITRRTVDDRQVDIHALRWTAVTRMLRRGVPIDIVAKLIGHQDTKLLMRIYADLGLEDRRAALVKAWGTEGHRLAATNYIEWESRCSARPAGRDTTQGGN